MEEEETLGESASPFLPPAPRMGRGGPSAVSRGLCKFTAVYVEARAQPSLSLVPLIQPPIEGCRHQARGQSTLPQKVVVILPAQLVRGFQGHP